MSNLTNVCANTSHENDCCQSVFQLYFIEFLIDRWNESAIKYLIFHFVQCFMVFFLFVSHKTYIENIHWMSENIVKYPHEQKTDFFECTTENLFSCPSWEICERKHTFDWVKVNWDHFEILKYIKKEWESNFSMMVLYL